MKHINYYRYENYYTVDIISAVHKLNNNKVQVLVQCSSNKKPVVDRRTIILLYTSHKVTNVIWHYLLIIHTILVSCKQLIVIFK